MRLSAGLAACVLLCGACGGAADNRSGAEPSSGYAGDSAGGEAAGESEPSSPMVDPGGAEMTSGWEDDLDEMIDAFGRTDQAFSAAADDARCDDAETLKQAVCDLRDRICRIAQEHPEANQRCGDAYERCESAESRFDQVCGG